MSIWQLVYIGLLRSARPLPPSEQTPPPPEWGIFQRKWLDHQGESSAEGMAHFPLPPDLQEPPALAYRIYSAQLVSSVLSDAFGGSASLAPQAVQDNIRKIVKNEMLLSWLNPLITQNPAAPVGGEYSSPRESAGSTKRCRAYETQHRQKADARPFLRSCK